MAKIRSCTPPHFDFLLEQPDPPFQVTVLGGLRCGDTGPVTVFDGGMAKPFRQRQRMDTEIVGDLSQRHPDITISDDTDYVVTELLRIRLGRTDTFQAAPSGKPVRMSPPRAVVPKVV